jgi:hypothetical protein
MTVTSEIWMDRVRDALRSINMNVDFTAEYETDRNPDVAAMKPTDTGGANRTNP